MEDRIICFLIDDDDDDQEIFSLALSNIDDNIHCITANDGIDALVRLNKEDTFTPNFIFLDLNMVRMNGRECLSEIRKIPRLDSCDYLFHFIRTTGHYGNQTPRRSRLHCQTTQFGPA